MDIFEKLVIFFPFFIAPLGNDTWLMFIPLTPIKTSSAGLLILAFITVILGFISLLLLLHLLGFHFYLCKTHPESFSPSPADMNSHGFPPGFTVHKGISTYEYIKLQRQKGSRNLDTEGGSPQGPKNSSKSPQVNAAC